MENDSHVLVVGEDALFKGLGLGGTIAGARTKRAAMADEARAAKFEVIIVAFRGD